MRVAVFGMGNMGRAFAARALEMGHHVAVWNRTANRAADLISSGAVEAHSPKEGVADSDVVLIVLADDEAVLSVCLGEHGVLNSLPAGAILAVVSTVSPDTVRRLAEVAPKGAVLDAPVMGSPSVIAAGMGNFLIGGPSPIVTGLDALWSDLGAGYRYCGPVGSGGRRSRSSTPSPLELAPRDNGDGGQRALENVRRRIRTTSNWTAPRRAVP